MLHCLVLCGGGTVHYPTSVGFRRCSFNISINSVWIRLGINLYVCVCQSGRVWCHTYSIRVMEPPSLSFSPSSFPPSLSPSLPPSLYRCVVCVRVLVRIGWVWLFVRVRVRLSLSLSLSLSLCLSLCVGAL